MAMEAELLDKCQEIRGGLFANVVEPLFAYFILRIMLYVAESTECH